MTSTIAWLDFSEEDQQRARKILSLFSQPGSVDELGIGTVRDALSDAMFRGTSVLQTRARYLLFIPWLFHEAKRLGRSGSELQRWVDRHERQLIEALRQGGAGGVGEGLIGRVAGERLKILPSAIYWTALQSFGILRRRWTMEQVAAAAEGAFGAGDTLTELVDRVDTVWDPGLPSPPQGFFQLEEASFSLTRHEADWLAERIEASVPGTLLAWLVACEVLPSHDGAAPWEEPSVVGAPSQIQRVVGHARLFSAALHGAALLYNLLVAERFRDRGLDQKGERVSEYSRALQKWASDLDGLPEIVNWQVSDFWEVVTAENMRIPPLTRSFVEKWIAIARSGDRHAVADSSSARQLVTGRERQLKGGRSRLANDRLLGEWTGASGAGRLTFRWDQVKVLLGDIVEGRST
ncbi:MAG: DUF6361 family protein [Actinomycetota bacterium]|nr:DUF6361 family protein [Actinomycetota bacterium]